MNLAGIDLNLLVAFDALYRERSVTRAGSRIGLSQPAASNALGRLRHLLDDPLFVRGAGGMVPTARARALAPEVAEILDRVGRALADRGRFDPATARRGFSLGLTDYGSTFLMPPLVRALARAAPGIDLRTRHALGTAGLQSLDERALDLLVTVIDRVPARFVRQTVLEEHFVVIARRGHPGLRDGLDLGTYAALPHLLVSFSGDVRGAVDRALAGHGLKRRVAATVAHFSAAPFIVAKSDLIATLAARVAATYRTPCRLAVHPVPLELPGYAKSLIWRRADAHDPAQAWFRQLVASIAKEI